MQQLSLRHKSLSSLFFLLYPSGIFQTSCICPTLTDFLSELPRSVALTNTQTCCEAPREHKTPVIYFDLDFFQALISRCFLLVGQEMASWLCLHCGYSPVLGAGRFCGCVGIFITGITWGLGMFSFHRYTFMRELKSPPAFSCRIPTDFNADWVHKYPLGISSFVPTVTHLPKTPQFCPDDRFLPTARKRRSRSGLRWDKVKHSTNCCL